MSDHRERWSRREFVGGMTLAGTVGLLGLRPGLTAAEPPPEVARIRITDVGGVCVAPQYIAADLLKAEGFSEVEYVKTPTLDAISTALTSGTVDFSMNFVANLLKDVDAGLPIVLLAGIHVGCYGLFGDDKIRTIKDLKGRRVAVPTLGAHHAFLAVMLSYVGVDPRKDVQWVTRPRAESIQLLADGKVDAYFGFAPDPQELRARRIGHEVVNSTIDRPWSQYFCCYVASNREFVQRHPVATKRTLRAILKAASMCALDPEGTARALTDRGFTKNYDYALQAMRELPYARWREYDQQDAVRFYALRLHEVGLIKSNPQKVIAQAANWLFVNELKKELKG
jgi:NitT/TauT family transport system substrate-binding protein